MQWQKSALKLSKLLKTFLALNLLVCIALNYNDIDNLQKRYEALKKQGAEVLYKEDLSALAEQINELKLSFVNEPTGAKKLFKKVDSQLKKIEKLLESSNKKFIPFIVTAPIKNEAVKPEYIFEGARINTKTGLTLTATAGYLISCAPGSNLKLKKAYFNRTTSAEEIVLEVIHGNITFDIPNSARDKFIIKVDKHIISVNNASLALHKYNDTIVIKVFSNFIIFDDQKIKKDNGILIHDEKIVIDEMPQPPTFINTQKTYILSPYVGLRLRWKRIREAAKYHLSVFSKENQTTPVFSIVTEHTSIEIPFDHFQNKKTYFAFVTALKPNGIESIFSKHPEFTIEIDSTPPKIMIK